MPVNLSVKAVPDELAAKLRQRAAANHRSLQGELLAILHAVVETKPAVSLDAIWELGAARGIFNASESTDIIRRMRDERYGR